MEGETLEWRWTGAVTRLSIKSALSVSDSRSSDLESLPFEFDLFITIYSILFIIFFLRIHMWQHFAASVFQTMYGLN